MSEPSDDKNHMESEIKGGGLFARNGIIEAVGESSSLPKIADTIIDMKGHVVIPGMVNTHHHLFQKLKPVPYQQAQKLRTFWLAKNTISYLEQYWTKNMFIGLPL